MKTPPSRIIAMIVSSIALVVVAVVRLTGRPAGPESTAAAETGPLMVASSIPIPTPADKIKLVWTLPDPNDLAAGADNRWTPPDADPFVISNRLLAAAGILPPDQSTDTNTDGPNDEPGPRTPAFSVTGTFRIKKQWFAEINGRVHTTGDHVDDFLITHIDATGIRVVDRAQSPTHRTRRTGPPIDVSCLLRVGDDVLARTANQWVRVGDVTPQGVVKLTANGSLTFVPTQTAPGPNEPTQAAEIEIPIEPNQ